jgi:DNA-binding transcriptional MerR regulator
VSMSALLTIGEFSRLTHLSVKALRHYDDVGLLEPAHVDAASGYRRYATSQVPVAQVIRRFRDLAMPLDQVQAVLAAPDVTARDRVIVAHL